MAVTDSVFQTLQRKQHHTLTLAQSSVLVIKGPARLVAQGTDKLKGAKGDWQHVSFEAPNEDKIGLIVQEFLRTHMDCSERGRTSRVDEAALTGESKVFLDGGNHRRSRPGLELLETSEKGLFIFIGGLFGVALLPPK